MEFFNKIKCFFLSVINFFFFFISINKKLKNNKKNLIVFSHDGSDKGGAPVVLFNLLNNMNLTNYNVIILFKNDGPLIKKCKEQGYDSYVYQYIYKFYLWILAEKVDSVIINTVICGNVVNFLQKNRKYQRANIVWWIHEGEDMFSLVQHKLPQKINKNVKVVCVSEISKIIFHKFYPNYNPEILHYGILDRFNKYISLEPNSKFVISVIGMLCDRKNQLQIVELVKKLPKEILSMLEINIVAATWDSEYKKKFVNQSYKIKQIKIINGLSHDKILKLYKKTNLLIACSRIDPLPVVVSEAMMMECPCLVSSGCGQFKYIKDGINSYKYNVNDVEEMKKKLLFAIKNTNNIKLRKKERETYLYNFSMQQAVTKMSKYIHMEDKVCHE